MSTTQDAVRHDDHPTPTPPPWTVGVWDRSVFVGGGPNNDDIAEFNFCDEHTVKITKDEAIANATLFAAAPGLWAACADIHRLRLVIESAVRNSDPKHHDIVVKVLRAVTAAANDAMVKP